MSRLQTSLVSLISLHGDNLGYKLVTGEKLTI